MAIEPTAASAASPSLAPARVYGMAVICLMAGLAIGYLFRGPHSPLSGARPAASVGVGSSTGGVTPVSAMPAGAIPSSAVVSQMAGKQPQPAVGAGSQAAPRGAMANGRMPTLEQMKQMADKQAAPLLEKLNSDPNNTDVLMQVGAIYYTTHRFTEASAYYDKALQIEPRNVAFRIKLATSLYGNGDVNGAIAQLNQALRYDPKDANALFDLGMIRLQGKQDGKGAVAAWQQLLKSNPQLSADRKAAAQKLMADVMTTLGDQHGIEGAGTNDAHN
jgi:cytochrome c-type biogenesis protein CcmH/NrfG